MEQLLVNLLDQNNDGVLDYKDLISLIEVLISYYKRSQEVANG